MRSRSIFAGDMLEDAEREKQKELQRPVPIPGPSGNDLKQFLLSTPLGGNILSASPGAFPSQMASTSDMRPPVSSALRAVPPSPMKSATANMSSFTFAPLVAEPEEQYTPPPTPAFLPRRSSIKHNAKLQQDRANLFASQEFNEIICDALILNLQVPPVTSRTDVAPRTQREVFYPAHLLGSIVSMQLEVGMLVELHDFINEVKNAVCKVVVVRKPGQI
ncbi:hypothetical protein HDU78_000718 [Chytriomyces hyalinus]|nr:hypothetical protein HDU78_000718 [Chytriomyces hyalinus]